MDRRTFLIRAGVAFPVVSGLKYLAGCDSGGADSDYGSTNNGQSSGTLTITATSSMSSGHSHVIGVPQSDLDRTSSETYYSSEAGGDLYTQGHEHRVTLTTSHFETLKTGGTVIVSSTNDSGHTHEFTFRKAS